jgi:non-heme chloroperoxidase
MRKVLMGLTGLIVMVLSVFAGALAFSAPVKLPPLASVFDPFADVNFSDLPAVRTYPARDGLNLGYRVYEGVGTQAVILIHGSSDDGSGMHPLAKALRDVGASVYVPVVRGHHQSGRSGDIDYIGQLEDDLADFVTVLRGAHSHASHTLIGFSAGGGFLLRVIGSPNEELFDRFIMISPALPVDAPTIRPGIGGWVSLAVPRIVALSILNRLGIHWYDGLPVVAFATSPQAPNLTNTYSMRLALNYGAPDDYQKTLGRGTKPVALLVGGDDELFYSDRFAPLLGSVRSDLRISIVPGVNHIGMTVAPEGIAAVQESLSALIASAKRTSTNRPIAVAAKPR